MFRAVATPVFARWLGEQPEEITAEVAAAVSLLEEFGPRLGRPHADTLKGSKFSHLKELRVKTAAAEIRIAFAFDPRRDAILLVAGDKRGVSEKRFYRKLIAKADAIYTEYLKSR